MTDLLWTPSAARVQAANLTRFAAFAAQRTGRAFPDYDTLYAWSVDDPAAFWGALWDFLGLTSPTPIRAVLEHPAMPGARWFPGATLNYAERLLAGPPDAIAIVGVDETGRPPEVVTRADLRRRVARFQGHLRRVGVRAGDRVAAWLPNRVETVVAMLATAGLGAVFSSASPDFAPKAVLDRFGQIRPKVLVAADGVTYAGKRIDLLPGVAEVAAALPDVASVVVVPVRSERPELDALPGAVLFPEAGSPDDVEPTFEPLPFDHPLYVLYSSGTTGKPKCIVHGAGGTLLQHAKEHVLHTDLGPSDVLFYYTTTGWMMWNWLVGGLATGAAIVLWDGSPVHPTPDVLWRMAAEHGVTVFGTSPRFLALCERSGVEPRDLDLGRLKAVLSTGSPLPVEGFRWVYEHVKADVQLASICGGTDIVSCFMLGCPTAPVYAGEIQKRGLGMAVEAWAGPGRPVVGQKGELVCTKPFPSMPLGFWGDEDGERYRRAYFDVFPGVWRHGDYVEITEHGGVVVYGRSDATLNPGGVRIGTAEVERPVEAMPEVSDTLVVGLPTSDEDVEVVMFVVPAPGVTLTPDLEQRIRRRIREEASPRHVPARLLAAPAVPRTISGKKVELAVQAVLLGQSPTNREALANPEALDWYAAEGRRLLGRG
jgi:acetoacetyl-CoA synthetase